MSLHTLDFIRDHFSALPALAKFALAMVMLVVIPRLSHRQHLPAAVGLLLGGVIIGPLFSASSVRIAQLQISWRNSASCY
jgi:Kef-type K+ transport system membrane component KefB